jgi:hypothetical protein
MKPQDDDSNAPANQFEFRDAKIDMLRRQRERADALWELAIDLTRFELDEGYASATMRRVILGHADQTLITFLRASFTIFHPSSECSASEIARATDWPRFEIDERYATLILRALVLRAQDDQRLVDAARRLFAAVYGES